MFVTEQTDWSAGMFRGRRAPENAFYDGVNVLLNDEGEPFKRGGSSFLTGTDAGGTLVGLAQTRLTGGTTPFTLAWSATNLYMTTGAGWISVGAATLKPLMRGAEIGFFWYGLNTSGSQILVTNGLGLAAPVAVPAPLTAASVVTTVGTPPRLIVAGGIYAAFSDPGTATFTAGNYHEMPGRTEIIGAQGVGDTLLLFTTNGIYAVTNMSLDPLDDFGNVQQEVAHVNGDLILWGDPGIAQWTGGLLVPAFDDIYVFNVGGAPQAISEAIRPLYRGYVAAGYRPGTAVVHRGHYFLPIVNGTTLVDVLVCRLDRGFAWTRWSGHAAGVAYAQRPVGIPVLLSVSAQRVLDLTGCMSPTDANRQDAVGGAPAFSLTTRDFDTGPGIKGGLLRHARLEYDLVAPSALAAITVASAAGAEGAAFTAHSATAPEADGGSKTWMLNRYGERLRLRLESSDATSDLRIRRLELHMQESQRP